MVVTNVNTGFTRTVASDDGGRYTFTLLPIGTYNLVVQKPGFKKYEQKDITLTANQVVGINPALEIGEVTQTVEVTGAAPLVNTQTSDISTVVESRQIRELPLNGRNIIQLATLTNGVGRQTLETVITSYPNSGGNTLSVNGNRVNMTQYNLDGADFGEPRLNGAMNYPNPDAIQEFRFITSNYSAQFGKNAGGILNAVITSGTNKVHGSLWEFNRNSALAARYFFLPENPFLNQNQFGFSVGGPAIKDKLFGFGSVQWLKNRGPVPFTSAFPPTAAERAGDFSAKTTPIIDPNTGTPFPGNIIPTARFDPVAVNYINFVPLPNISDGRFVGVATRPIENRQITLKSDYDISQKNRLSVSLFRDVADLTNPANGSDVIFVGDMSDFKSTISTRQTRLVVGHTYTFGSNLLNDFRFNYHDIAWKVTGQHPVTLNTLGGFMPVDDFGGTGIKTPIGPPGMMAPGRFSGTPGLGWWLIDKRFQFIDNVSYTKGAHQLKLGVDIQDLDMNHLSTFIAQGHFFGFGGVTGDTLADFMLGKTTGFMSNPVNHSGYTRTFAAYVQDDFKVTRNLVVNLGLRYQLSPMWMSPASKKMEGGELVRPVSSFIEGQQSTLFHKAPTGLVYPRSPGFAGDPGVPDRLVATRWTDFAPRVGFAWDMFGDGKTSLRAGWGVFYGSAAGQNTDNFTLNPPFSWTLVIPVTPSLVNAIPPAQQAIYPIKYGPDIDYSAYWPWDIRGTDRFAPNPMTQEFNVTVQRQFPGSVTLEAAYVGNISRHLFMSRELNVAKFIPGTDALGNPLSTFANLNERRRFNQPFLPQTPYGTFQNWEPSNDSSYHALQLQARKPLSRGLSFLLSYTWSKTMDICSGGGNGLGGVGDCTVQDPLNLEGDRGLSGLHQAHRWVTSFDYNTPSLSRAVGNNPVVRHIFDDWQLTGILSFGSGFPFTVYSGFPYSLTQAPLTSGERPNLVGNPKLSTDRPRSQLIQEYFNTAAFELPATGAFGSSGRNILIGPGSVNVDMAVYKNILVAENKKVQLRFEFFNLPNRPNFSEPVANLSAGGANGRIFGSGPGRIIQLGAKFNF